MKYAIFETNGKQFQGVEGKTLTVNAFLGEKDTPIVFDHVLFFTDGDKTEIGCPYIKGAVIEGKIIKSGKGKKIDIQKFKAKVRYRRHTGFRPLETTIQIEKIKIKEEETKKKTLSAVKKKPRSPRKKPA